jgi:hypothetical protein
MLAFLSRNHAQDANNPKLRNAAKQKNGLAALLTPGVEFFLNIKTLPGEEPAMGVITYFNYGWDY